MLQNLFDHRSLDQLRVEDLRKLNELLQKQPKATSEKPITWADSKASHKSE